MRIVLRVFEAEDCCIKVFVSRGGDENRQARPSALHRLHCGCVSSHLTFRVLGTSSMFEVEPSVEMGSLLADNASSASLGVSRTPLLSRLRGDLHITIRCSQSLRKKSKMDLVEWEEEKGAEVEADVEK